MSPGAIRREACCTARSSMSAGTASKPLPASASSVCRARLCEARISGNCPRQRLMLKAVSFGQPLPLPVGEQLEDGGRGFFDRAPRHVKLRPIEPGAQSPRKRDLIGNRLAIDIFV